MFARPFQSHPHTWVLRYLAVVPVRFGKPVDMLRLRVVFAVEFSCGDRFDTVANDRAGGWDRDLLEGFDSYLVL